MPTGRAPFPENISVPEGELQLVVRSRLPSLTLERRRDRGSQDGRPTSHTMQAITHDRCDRAHLAI